MTKERYFYTKNNFNQRKEIDRISTGSKNLDELLFGGIETHAITEFYGPSGVGKTQLCHTLCVTALQKEEGSTVVYIDAEAKFRPERISLIAQARGLNSIDLLSHILYAISSHHQEIVLEKLVANLRKKENKKKISLIIVDTIISHYRAEFLSCNMLPRRQQKLYRFMYTLSTIAQTYRIAVVITNQVNSGNCYMAKPTGGNIMDYASNYRISLRRLIDSNYIVAKVVKSSYHPQSEAWFRLSKKGIQDIEDNAGLG